MAGAANRDLMYSVRPLDNFPVVRTLDIEEAYYQALADYHQRLAELERIVGARGDE